MKRDEEKAEASSCSFRFARVAFGGTVPAVCLGSGVLVSWAGRVAGFGGAHHLRWTHLVRLKIGGIAP